MLSFAGGICFTGWRRSCLFYVLLFPKGERVAEVTWTKSSVLDGLLQPPVCLLVYRTFIFFRGAARMRDTL